MSFNNSLDDSWKDDNKKKGDSRSSAKANEKVDVRDRRKSSDRRPSADFQSGKKEEAKPNDILRQSSKVHSLKPKKKEVSDEEKGPILESTGTYEIKSYCRGGLHTYIEQDRHKSLKMLKNGIRRFPSENYEDLDFFILKNDFKVYIVITINDEIPAEVNETLDGIIVNIYTLHRKLEMTGNDVVVVVVANGMKNLSPEYKKMLFNDEEIMSDPCERPSIIEANKHYYHLFISKYNNKVKEIPQEHCTVNVLFMIKEGHHGIKNCILNFYYGIVHELATKANQVKEYDIEERLFSLILKPRDVLHKHAIYKFILHFEYYPSAGGLFGEMEVDVSQVKCNSMEASQFLENKLDLVYDRHFENNFNYVINDTPNLFSYRVKSILLIGVQNHTFFQDVVDNYTSTLDTNIYQDTEKAINLDLMGMKYEAGLIKYVPDAICIYQGSKNLPGYLSEKRKHVAATFCAYFNYLFPKELIRSEKTSLQKGLYIIFAIFWCLNFILKLLAMGISYCLAYVMLSFCFVNVKTLEGWLLGYYGVILFMMIVLSLSRNGPENLSTPYHILIFMMVPFTCLALGTFIVSIIYLFAWTDGKVKVVSAILIPTVIIYSYVLPGALNIKRLCKSVAMGVWAYSIYNTTSINLIPIFSYCNIDDFDTTLNCPSDEIRRERRNNFSFSKLKVIVFYFFINLFMVFVFVQQQLSNDDWKLNYVEYVCYYLAWFLGIKGTFSAIDFWYFHCKVKIARKDNKPKIIKYLQEAYEEHVKRLKDFDHNYVFRFRKFNPEGFDEETEKINIFANPNVSVDPISMRSQIGLGLSGDESAIINNLNRPSIFNRKSPSNSPNRGSMNSPNRGSMNSPNRGSISPKNNNRDSISNANQVSFSVNIGHGSNDEIPEESPDAFNTEGSKNSYNNDVMSNITNEKRESNAYSNVVQKNRLSNALGLNFVNASYNSEKVDKVNYDMEVEKNKDYQSVDKNYNNGIFLSPATKVRGSEVIKGNSSIRFDEDMYSNSPKNLKRGSFGPVDITGSPSNYNRGASFGGSMQFDLSTNKIVQEENISKANNDNPQKKNDDNQGRRIRQQRKK